MERRRLRGTDLDLSVITYGPMRATTNAEAGDAERTFRTVLDQGINSLHSSYEYGVRWMMHEVLKDHPKRHELHHTIKVPVPDWDDAGFDAAKFEQRIDEALGELCTDRIALVQWMWRIRPHDEEHRLPRLAAVIDDAIATFERLRDKGKVGHLATFPYFVESARAALAKERVRALIAYYNPLEMEMATLFDELDASDRGFLAIRPFYEGILTDRYADPAALPADHRLAKEKYRPQFAARAALAEAFPQETADGMTRFALRFPLAHPGCASVIVGINTVEQARMLASMTDDVTPDTDLVRRVEAFWRERVAG